MSINNITMENNDQECHWNPPSPFTDVWSQTPFPDLVVSNVTSSPEVINAECCSTFQNWNKLQVKLLADEQKIVCSDLDLNYYSVI